MRKGARPRPWGWGGRVGGGGQAASWEAPPASSTTSEGLMWPPTKGAVCVRGVASSAVLTACPEPSGRLSCSRRRRVARTPTLPAAAAPGRFCLPRLVWVCPGPSTRVHTQAGTTQHRCEHTCTHAQHADPVHYHSPGGGLAWAGVAEARAGGARQGTCPGRSGPWGEGRVGASLRVRRSSQGVCSPW